MTIAGRYRAFNDKLQAQLSELDRIPSQVTLIAVSKTQPIANIVELVDCGHRHFGENKIQEALQKFQSPPLSDIDLQLHFIGHLQSNKAAQAVSLFNYIHSVDRLSLIYKLKKEMDDQQRYPRLFLQVNLGQESQKSGASVTELEELVAVCHELKLPVIGLMAIPPAAADPVRYFAQLQELAKQYQLPELSMGMSGDYQQALIYNATFIRIGTALFGPRH